MATRKYAYYQVVSESTSTQHFDDYKEAFSTFSKTDESATLYGIDEFGEVSVITSK